MPKIKTRRCPRCGKVDEFEVPQEAIDAWDNGRGEYVQHAFPMLNADQREQLLTGYDKECWDKLFAFEE